MKRFALILLCLAVVSGSPLLAQAQKGAISASVVGDDGQPLPGVTMDVSAPDTLTRSTVVTNAQGFAEARGLDPSRAYKVVLSLEGMATVEQDNILVRAGQTVPLRVTMSMSTVAETIQVTGEVPVVDVTNAVTGQDITLELTNALPTGRSYQSYLQLVPGVLPESQLNPGNPASRSGVNYSDILGRLGRSTDNRYYIEGINVTDSVTGTFGANLNSEIIQEQSVLTGGIPAEFAGAAGLISNVITKSGGNNFSGAVTTAYQDESMLEDNEHRGENDFSTYDVAATLGGPIVQDKAWFFASYRVINREEDVVAPDGTFLRSITVDDDQAFGKLTWSITPSTLFSGSYMTDPQDRSGSNDFLRTNALDFAREQGGDRYVGRLTQVAGNFLLEGSFTKNEFDLDDLSVINEPRNTVASLLPDVLTQAQQQRGGFGQNFLETRGSEAWNVSGEASFDTSWGSHTLKLGYEEGEFNDLENQVFIDDVNITSLSSQYLGQNVTAEDVANAASTLEFDVSNSSDTNGLRQFGLASNPAVAAALDANHDGFVSNEEMATGIIFNSTAGNPHGQINYQRDLQVSSGEAFYKSEGTIWYLQDTWQWNKWAINAGVRAEGWDHFDTLGTKTFGFDEEIAPRVSVAYDVKGDGRQRISAFYGKYFDPIRNDMTQFTGTVTGSILHEQVFINGQWLTYRIRGGPQVPDAIWAPTTETPYTEEWQLGYKVDVGQNMSFEVNGIKRETRDIFEDYDMALYAVDPDGVNHYPGNHLDPNSLWLGPGYFGFSGAPPPSNFVVATLFGSKRDWEGLELIFRKRYSNNWQMLTSVSINDAEGNSNSDGNADFQGDVLFLDPRAPNQFGTQPGLIEQLVKVAGSYRWDNGLELGGTVRWSSGVLTSKTFRASSRNLPCSVHRASCGTSAIPNFDFGGVAADADAPWIEPGAVGGLDNPSYTLFDARIGYEVAIGEWGNLDLFLNVFNVLDDQATIRNQDLFAGRDGVAFGDGLEFVDPRRYVIGANFRF